MSQRTSKPSANKTTAAKKGGKAKEAVHSGVFEWLHNTSSDDLRRSADVLAHLTRWLTGGPPSVHAGPTYCNNCRDSREWNCSFCGRKRA